jgi:hypothetical protein
MEQASKTNFEVEFSCQVQISTVISSSSRQHAENFLVEEHENFWYTNNPGLKTNRINGILLSGSIERDENRLTNK